MAFLQPHSGSASKVSIDDLGVLHARKLKEFKNALDNVGVDAEFIAVDAMQRLGLDHHFQKEIEAILQKEYARIPSYNDDDHELAQVSLRFRLLRQHGYHVTTDGLVKKLNKNTEEFEYKGIKRLVELYEASQLSFEGEDALDESGKLSYQLLTAWLPHNLDDDRSAAVAHSLAHPYHKSLTRFMAKHFLNHFQGGDEQWANPLRELATLESQMVESLIQNEILQISKWWKELGLTKELKFARDQPVKWYTWPMACLTDPSLSEERVELTKSISLVYIIDDIFDVHGTLDELILFTAAVERWDLRASDELPKYMKTTFKALYEITNETSKTVYRRRGWNPIESLRKSWAKLCKAFLLEAQWLRQGHLPNAEDYLKNGLISTGVPAVLTHAFFILGQGISKTTIEILNNIDVPAGNGIISSTATILRLWDDFGSAKDENQDGYDGSYIKCYLNEHEGCSDEDARAHVIHKISNEWKKLNKQCFSSSNPFSANFTELALNVGRMVPLMYDYNTQHRLPSLEENMKSLMFESFMAQGMQQGSPI